MLQKPEDPGSKPDTPILNVELDASHQAFQKWAIPGLFLFILVFLKQTLHFLQQTYLCVNPEKGAVI